MPFDNISNMGSYTKTELYNLMVSMSKKLKEYEILIARGVDMVVKNTCDNKVTRVVKNACGSNYGKLKCTSKEILDNSTKCEMESADALLDRAIRKSTQKQSTTACHGSKKSSLKSILDSDFNDSVTLKRSRVSGRCSRSSSCSSSASGSSRESGNSVDLSAIDASIKKSLRKSQISSRKRSERCSDSF